MNKRVASSIINKLPLHLFIFIFLSGCANFTFPVEVTGTMPESLRPSYTATITAYPILSPTLFLTNTVASRHIVTPRPTSTGRPVPSHTPTAIPTLNWEESRAYTLELLRSNGGCDLPCFWDIVPGRTILTNTLPLFTYLGWEGSYFYLDDIRKNYETNSGEIIKEVEVLMTLSVKDSVVDSMLITFVGDKTLAVPYTIDGLLSKYGVTSRIEINLAVGRGYEVSEPQTTPYNLLLFYDQLGVMAEYNGVATKYGSSYRLCLTDFFPGEPERKDSISAHLILKTSDNPKTLEEIAEYFGTSTGGYSLTEVTGISNEEFYNLIIQRNGKSYCIETPRDAWP